MHANSTFKLFPKTLAHNDTPTVLHTKNIRNIEFPTITLKGRKAIGIAAQPTTMAAFNPSIALAPINLCAKCKWVIAIRVDALHRCNTSSPAIRHKGTGHWFSAAAIAIYDAHFELLGWTWFINDPNKQVANWERPRRGPFPGSADGDDPPWFQKVRDVRLLNYHGRLFATYGCRHCAFAVSLVHMSAIEDEDGNPSRFRAWAVDKFRKRDPWIVGRNQALFVEDETFGDRLLVQPWPGIIATFGAPRFKSTVYRCYPGMNLSPHVRGVQEKSQTFQSFENSTSLRLCGTTAPGNFAKVESIAQPASTLGGPVRVIQNGSIPNLSRKATGGYRVSLTSNLVRIDWNECSAFLGIAHVHRAEGTRNKLYGRNGMNLKLNFMKNGSSRIDFGYVYTHAFYTLQPHPPYSILGISPEFCLGSAQQPDDCEIIQFISGMALTDDAGESKINGNRLVLTFGVNDCEAKMSTLDASHVLDMLVPLAKKGKRRGHVCVNQRLGNSYKT